MKKNNLSDTIAQLLSKNAGFLKENTLKGKLGLSLFLFQYSKLSNKHHFGDVAFEVLDYSINKELLLTINDSKLDFSSGVTGVGVFMISMLEENYFETDLNEILLIIDKRIYRDLDMLTRVNDKKNISTLLSLLTYLKFRQNKTPFFSEYEKLLNDEAILLTEISILYLLQNNQYKTYLLFSSIIDHIETIKSDHQLTAIKHLLVTKKSNTPKPIHISSSSPLNKILSLYFKKQQSKKEYKIDYNTILENILSNQNNVAGSFLYAINLGLLYLGENNMFMRFFWDFLMLDFVDGRPIKKKSNT